MKLNSVFKFLRKIIIICIWKVKKKLLMAMMNDWLYLNSKFLFCKLIWKYNCFEFTADHHHLGLYMKHGEGKISITVWNKFGIDGVETKENSIEKDNIQTRTKQWRGKISFKSFNERASETLQAYQCLSLILGLMELMTCKIKFTYNCMVMFRARLTVNYTSFSIYILL